jgi:hypothetical protein
MGQLKPNLTRDGRMAEFPGLLQGLPTHTGLLETLAVSILKYVQSQQMTAEEREAEYLARLNQRFADKSVDLAVIPAVVALAQDLHLFDDREPLTDKCS